MCGILQFPLPVARGDYSLISHTNPAFKTKVHKYAVVIPTGLNIFNGKFSGFINDCLILGIEVGLSRHTWCFKRAHGYADFTSTLFNATDK